MFLGVCLFYPNPLIPPSVFVRQSHPSPLPGLVRCRVSRHILIHYLRVPFPFFLPVVVLNTSFPFTHPSHFHNSGPVIAMKGPHHALPLPTKQSSYTHPATSLLTFRLLSTIGPRASVTVPSYGAGGVDNDCRRSHSMGNCASCLQQR